MSDGTDIDERIRALGLSEEDALVLKAAHQKTEEHLARLAASRDRHAPSRLAARAPKPATAPTPKPPAAKPADSTAANDAAPKVKSTGEFFAVDRRTWHRVCGLGMNAAVAYLVLAKGTLRDNRRTSWSVNSVETYGGIPRDKARKAVEALIADGALVQTQGGTKPRYELPAWHELNRRAELTPDEQAVFERVKAGESLPEFASTGRITSAWREARQRHEKALACARSKGWLAYSNGAYSVAPDPDPKPDLAWLPNALVEGLGDGVPSVLERVRQTQDASALRLLVDLYSVHNLLSEGGIPRDVTYQPFERVQLGERGVFVVWGFKPGVQYVRWGSPTTDVHKREKFAADENNAVDWFARMNSLKNCGAIEWMSHLYESESPDASVVHPYGLDWTADALTRIENALGQAAHKAGVALLRLNAADHIPNASENLALSTTLFVAPLPKHMASVAMVGIVRLRLKPHTSRTREWMGDLHGTGPDHIANYARIERGETHTAAHPIAKPAPAPVATAKR